MAFLDNTGVERLWQHIIAKLGNKMNADQVIPIEQGGTGATTVVEARNHMGISSGTTLPTSGSEGDIFFLYS